MSVLSADDSTFETVSDYVGFITGITGIVLSVVAMVFAIIVQKEASRVNDQTIRTLTKIESVVERLSQDTTSLIKAAWDKMLDSGPGQGQSVLNDHKSNLPIDEIKDGLVAEVRSEIVRAAKSNESDSKKLSDLERRLERMSTELEKKVTLAISRGRPAQRLEKVITSLVDGGALARELVRFLSDSSHLSSSQYHHLLGETILRDALVTLRNEGIVIPLRTRVRQENGVDDPVYWISPEFLDSIRAAMLVLPQDDDAAESVKNELLKVGYGGAGNR